MKFNTCIKRFNNRALIEVVEGEFRRIFYGSKIELDKATKELLDKAVVEEINCFLAEVAEGTFQPAVQIRIRM